MAGINSTNDYAVLNGGGGNDLLNLLLLSNSDILGNRNNCCPSPATTEQVCAVDRDVMEKANETQREIDRAEHELEEHIHDLEDKITAGNYANLSNSKDIINAIEKGNAVILGTIKTTALEQENKAQAEKICAQNEKINRMEIIEALKSCEDKK